MCDSGDQGKPPDEGEADEELTPILLSEVRGEALLERWLTTELSTEVVQSGLVDREGWGAGPWDGEPDQVVWRGPHGYPCMVWRHDRYGQLNGYVAVPAGHPAHGLDYGADALDELEVHGGLTFAGGGIKGWWVFGFDCGHGGRDVQPGMEAMLTGLGIRTPFLLGVSSLRPSYKPLPFVRDEVESLARQLARIAGIT
jgi:hypothetical protein